MSFLKCLHTWSEYMFSCSAKCRLVEQRWNWAPLKSWKVRLCQKGAERIILMIFGLTQKILFPYESLIVFVTWYPIPRSGKILSYGIKMLEQNFCAKGCCGWGRAGTTDKRSPAWGAWLPPSHGQLYRRPGESRCRCGILVSPFLHPGPYLHKMYTLTVCPGQWAGHEFWRPPTEKGLSVLPPASCESPRACPLGLLRVSSWVCAVRLLFITGAFASVPGDECYSSLTSNEL